MRGRGRERREGGGGGGGVYTWCVVYVAVGSSTYVFPHLGVYVHMPESHIQCIRPPPFMCGFAPGTLHECSC